MKLPRATTLLPKQDVIAWLRTLEPDTIVGKPRSPSECPLQSYLTQRYPHVLWRVDGGAHIMGDISTQETFIRRFWPVAAWARGFIEHVDECTTTVITAQDALALLGAVQRSDV